uniref:Ig-like domain-containing protein n=1 Tax=Anabas testudineus TaxID=64144 RepID=A0AAQ6ICZ3_ANATE
SSLSLLVIFLFLLVLDAVLTLDPNWSSFFTGESVTFICDMKEGKHTDWEYTWSKDEKRTSNSNEAQVDGEENRDIRVSKGGIYRCRGRRGEPVYYTDYSYEVTVEITGEFRHFTPIKLIELIQYFSFGEKITVRCEIQGGGDTEWDYEWKTPQSTSHQTHVNYWTLSVSESSSGNYMCRGRNRRGSYSSTQWSKTITLTVSGQFDIFIYSEIQYVKFTIRICSSFLCIHCI